MVQVDEHDEGYRRVVAGATKPFLRWVQLLFGGKKQP